MATKAIPGFDGQVLISNDGGSTFNKIGELRDMTLNVEDELIDATSHDSGAWRESINGLRNFSISAEELYIRTDAGQSNAFTAITAKTLLKIQFRVKDLAGEDQYEGAVRVGTFEQTAPNDDAASSSLEFTGTGALTLVAVA